MLQLCSGPTIKKQKILSQNDEHFPNCDADDLSLKDGWAPRQSPNSSHFSKSPAMQSFLCLVRTSASPLTSLQVNGWYYTTAHNSSRCLTMQNPLLSCNLHGTDHNVLKRSTAKNHADPDWQSWTKSLASLTSRLDFRSNSKRTVRSINRKYGLDAIYLFKGPKAWQQVYMLWNISVWTYKTKPGLGFSCNVSHLIFKMTNKLYMTNNN